MKDERTTNATDEGSKKRKASESQPTLADPGATKRTADESITEQVITPAQNNPIKTTNNLRDEMVGTEVFGNGSVDHDKDRNESRIEAMNLREDGVSGSEQSGGLAVVNGATKKNDGRTTSSSHDGLRWIVVRNDGNPESMIKLVGLKSLFAKQLPKMPRAYIARLVFDRRHTSLAILSENPAVKDSDEEIIGGICYRVFADMKFAEIAFCAVSSTHQVKGYGTKLMSLLKQLLPGLFLITYADNFAIGYFKKQGFSKSITMPKGRWFGHIKEYDGGTPMECYVHPSIDYSRIPEMLNAQRQFILKRLELVANSRKVYEPLTKDFTTGTDGGSRSNNTAAKAITIPGILEAGWTLADLREATGPGKDAGQQQKTALKTELLAMVRKVEEQQWAWPFREPVDTNEVPVCKYHKKAIAKATTVFPSLLTLFLCCLGLNIRFEKQDYLDIVKEPTDLSTIEKRIRQDGYYRSKEMVLGDLMLIVNNCRTYNDDGSTYVQCAKSMEKFINEKLR